MAVNGSVRTMVLAAGMLVLGAQGAWAQAPQHRLGDPDATFAEAFGLVQGVRELPGGRVMVADPLGQALVILDMSTGAADTLGGVGQGPDEYRQPDGLFPLPNDSTLMVDLGNGRITVVGPDGSFGNTTPIAFGTPGPGGNMMIRLPQAIDAQGRLYFRNVGGMGRGPQLPTHGAILRWDRATGAVDSVGMVQLQAMTRSTSGGPQSQRVAIQEIPLSPSDGWAVAPDGSVALVRADEYRVEWVRPDGRVVQGESVSFRPVRIGQAEKREYFERRQQIGGGVSVGITVQNGAMTTTFARGGAPDDEPDPDAYQWPDVKPPFVANSARVTLAGELWVQREGKAGDPPTFDVFDRDGRLTSQVIAPAGRRLAGFGDGVVYLVRTDEFDLQYLERYRQP
jgi:hypothetical protein